MFERMLVASARRTIQRILGTDGETTALDADQAGNARPRWRLRIQEDYAKGATHPSWVLEAIHDDNDKRINRVEEIRWLNTLKQTHASLKLIEKHATPPGTGLHLTPEEIAELYQRTGAEHGPAKITVLVSKLKYHVHINDANPDNFRAAIDEVYSPTDPPTKPRRRWKADERNPRHPRWEIVTLRADSRDHWSLSAVHHADTPEPEIRITRLQWHTPILVDGTEGVTTAPAADYTPAEIAAMVANHADPEKPLTVEISVRGTAYVHEPPTRDTAAVKNIIDTIYDPES